MRARRNPAIASLLLIVLTGAASCVSGFKQYYIDKLGPNAAVVELNSGDPEVYSGADPQKDYVAMVENGFVLAGISNFNGPPESKEHAMAQGRTVHAAVVLVYSHYTNTVTTNIPYVVNNPDQVVTTQAQGMVYGTGGTASYSGSSTSTVSGGQTVYNIPYSTARYDQMAAYWVRRKPSIFGVQVRDLTPEERSQIQRNRGVVVTAVIKHSPAFDADFLHNDILLRINSDELEDAASFPSAMYRHAGEAAEIGFLRAGEFRTARVKLNPSVN
jgi:serine protease Do